MPQMAPLMWMILFLMFSTLFMMAMVKTFFLFKKFLNYKNIKFYKTNKVNNWKW